MTSTTDEAEAEKKKAQDSDIDIICHFMAPYRGIFLFFRGGHNMAAYLPKAEIKTDIATLPSICDRDM